MSSAKIAEYRYKTLKGPSYYRVYEQRFAALRDQPIDILELGVQGGGCLEIWRDYFPQGAVVGLDKSPISIEDASGRICMFQGLQQDRALLDRIATQCAPKGFDIIIDDASHIAEHARVSFWHLLEYHLKPGGLYVIEDWGTGYWGDWPDGKAYDGSNHTAGMVGLVKEIIDEVAAADRRSSDIPSLMGRPSLISSLEICHGLVIVRKNLTPSFVLAER